jgi:nicotinate-nucleotide adenylyltransferase
VGRRVSGRFGVLGGTFDPPHIGHLWLATLAIDVLELDRVLFVPARRPPHKRSRRAMSAPDDRVAMTRAAIAGDPNLELSLVELERDGPSYTIDTIEALRASLPRGERPVLLMAADSLAQIETWREPDRLLSLVEWAVAARPGTELPSRTTLRRRFGASARRIHLLDGPALAVSSSEIRRRVAAGRVIRYLVPRDVERWIAEHGLYRPR